MVEAGAVLWPENRSTRRRFDRPGLTARVAVYLTGPGPRHMPAVKKTLRAASIDLMLLQQEMNRLFERLATLGRPERTSGGEWVPSVDVYECDGCLRVVVEVPGLQPDSIRVTYREGELTISGERRDRRPQGVTGFLCMERPHGRFTRSLALDVSLDVRQAQ